MLTRRHFTLGALAGSGLTALGCESQAPAGKVVDVAAKAANYGSGSEQMGSRSISKVGIQAYTLRHLFTQDPRTMLQLVKDTGYDFIELSGLNYTQIKPQELKDLLDDIGLASPASHVPLSMFRDDIPGVVKLSRLLGLEYVVLPWIAQDQRTPEHWKSHASILNAAGKALKGEGIKLAYHHHDFEFEDLGNGTTAMDLLFGEIDPEHMDFEIDFFWASLAEVDIPGLFKAHPGRFKLCHIKDMGPNKEAYADVGYEKMTSELMKNVGEGIVPFETYFAMNDLSGLEYFIVEHDNPAKPYAQAIGTSLKNIKGFRF